MICNVSLTVLSDMNRFDLGKRQKLDTEVSFPIEDLMFNLHGDMVDSKSNGKSLHC